MGEGVLTKMCRKKPKARQFFLFNDTLVYGNIVISKKKVFRMCILLFNYIGTVYAQPYLFSMLQYNKQHIIPLEEIKLQSLEDDGRKSYRKEIILPLDIIYIIMEF